MRGSWLVLPAVVGVAVLLLMAIGQAAVAPVQVDHPAVEQAGVIPVLSDPSSIAFDARNGDLYVTDEGSDEVSVISGSNQTVIGSIPIGGAPVDIVFDNATGTLFADFDTHPAGIPYLAEINTTPNRVSKNITVGPGGDYGVAYDSANGFVYEQVGGNISAVDPANATRPFQLSAPGADPAFDPANGYLYDTAGRGPSPPTPGMVWVFNATSSSYPGGPRATIEVGPGPLGILADGETNTIYVDTYLPGNVSGNVTLINGASDAVGNSIVVGENPIGLAVDPALGDLLVTTYGSNVSAGNVSLIDLSTDQVVGAIPVGLEPVAVTVDPTTGYVYVVNSGSDTVSYFLPGPPSASPSPNLWPAALVPAVGVLVGGLLALGVAMGERARKRSA
jgi:YVTN family beta-propeller protein